MTNAALAGRVAELANLMALDGGDAHRVAHYRKTATALRRFHHPLAEMIEGGVDLSTVPGIGKGLAGVLEDLVLRGSSSRLEAYRARVPAGLVDVMRLDGVGATRARTLGEAGVDSVEKLEKMLASREIVKLDGFGPGVLARLQRGLAARAALAGKSLLSRADRGVRRLSSLLAGQGFEVRLAGDVRRRAEIVATCDLVCGATPGALWSSAADLADVCVEGGRGENPLQVSCDGVKIRLVAAPQSRVEQIAHHLTGPPAYIEALQARARSRGLELTPMGIGDEDGEAGIYERLGLPRIAPELREDGTTIERAEAGLPRLVECGDIKGDLHMHTTWSDGAATIRRMAQAAADRGYSYVAITDHSPSTRVAGGLDAQALRAQGEEIDRVQRDFAEVRILRGCEVDILPDGSLDHDDEVLAGLDLVVISVHSAFEMSEVQMTDRIIRAMENPYVHILGHPTGRKLGRRNPYPVDLHEVLRAAAQLKVAVEVNSNPRRLDLDHRGLWLCGELGVSVVVNSDAHSVARLDNVRYGVDQARRGWLQATNIVNTGPLAEMLHWIRQRRN